MSESASAGFDPILPGDPPPLRPTLVRGEGVLVFDVDGHRYLDAISGTFCMQLGYGREDLARAMAEAAGRLPFARPLTFESEHSQAYLRELLEAVGAPYSRAILTSSGSDAVEAALKAAWLYQRVLGRPERREVTSLEGHFHGATIQTLRIGDYRPRRDPYEPLLGASAAVDPAHEDALERSLENAFALIAETVPGPGLGAAVPRPAFLDRVRRACDRAGALWIADEVLTGFGRTGRMFAWQRIAEGEEDLALVPDVVVFGKGAGCGYAPLAGILLHERVAAALEKAPGGRFIHAQSYGGHAVACAVGRRVLAALREEKIEERVRSLEPRLEAALEPLARHEMVREVRGLGFFRGILLCADRGTGAPFERRLRVAERVEARCREKGLLVFSGSGSFDGEKGDHILVAPPLVSETHHFAQIGLVLRQALDDVLRDVRREERDALRPGPDTVQSTA